MCSLVNEMFSVKIIFSKNMKYGKRINIKGEVDNSWDNWLKGVRTFSRLNNLVNNVHIITLEDKIVRGLGKKLRWVEKVL